uniref:Envelope protein n=1 Tax=Oryctolagus cuniculus TaxID=9986 RepID=A0A5F9CS71_RABIT
TSDSSCGWWEWGVLPLACSNPHEPQLLTWEVISPIGRIAWSVQGTHTPGTWWPPLYPDVCQLVVGLDDWDLGDLDEVPLTRPHDPDNAHTHRGSGLPGCGLPDKRCLLRQLDYYVCPKDGRTRQQERQCGGLESLYCKAWGCETTGSVHWKPSSQWDWISVHRNYIPEGYTMCLFNPKVPGWCHSTPLCNPLNITFTNKGKELSTLAEWIKGRAWGLRYYVSGTDFGLWFTIRLKKTVAPVAVGPNPAVRPNPIPEVKPKPPFKPALTEAPSPKVTLPAVS